jgi:hypothetical protein
LKLPEGSPQYDLLYRWVQQGARRIQRRRLVNLVVTPNHVVLDRTGQTIPVQVTAQFDDSQSRNVTSSTVLTADDPDAVSIDLTSGSLAVSRRGIHTVIARFLDRVVPIRLTVPLNDQVPKHGTTASDNEIDRLINKQLGELRLPTSPPTSDSLFLRRVSLDLQGRLPTLAEYRRFESEPEVDKLLDRLLGSDQYATYWAFKLANTLSVDAKQLQPEGAEAFHAWLVEQVASDTPVTTMAAAMLTSSGDSYINGPPNFLRSGSSPGDLAEHASSVFMGVRLRCANCHNHPLDHWTQDDYHGLAAVFAKVKRGRVVTVANRGEVTHPVTRQAAIPRIPGTRFLEAGSDGRAEFADWLTQQNNPYLARVTVNRIWQQLMGRGLVEPVDDLRATNPASNPELLDWLAQDFADHGFRLKHTVRAICRTQAYRRSSQSVPGNESDSKFFSHGLTRTLAAEVICDAIEDATGVPIPHGDQTNLRAVALTNNRIPSAALDVLGRCDRSLDCAAGSSGGTSLARTLHLINGPLINDRISDPAGRLAKLLASESDDERIVDTLHLITVGQLPNNRPAWQQRLSEANLQHVDQRREFFEDLFWGLLTSDSFITNH